MSNKNWINFGAIIKKKDGGFYIKLNDQVEVLNVNGNAVKNRYINVSSPVTKFERMLEKGVIDEAEFNSKVEAIPDFVKYELTIAPDK